MKKELIEEVANAASGGAVLDPQIDEQGPDHGTMRPWVALSILLGLALIWGSSFILMKKGLKVFTPLEVANLRIFTAFCALIPFAIPRIKEIPGKSWKYILLSGFTGSYIPAFLFSWAGVHLSSAVSGSLNALSPLFTVLVGIAFFGIGISRLGFVGIMIGLAGALALCLSRASATGGFVLDAWALPVVAATIMYAINLNLIKVNLKEVNSLTISSVSICCIGLVAGIVLFGFTDFTHKFATAPEGFWFAFGCVVTLGLFGTAISLVIYNRLIKFTSPVVASSVT